ncbi:tyrosine-type recombinase/integrase [Enterococcus faecalis]|uniref:tyrosine-type recombinase/integrase n=1 Tax=Enterococcus faecalis TaxID=1351 RepID=UPI00115EB65B|nr:tyrosine-type recombinase/integrase [Enterococcus faecalis]
MATFKDYKLKSGEKKWLFKTYLGKDLNGKPVQTTKRGFNTITDAKKAELQLQIDFLEKLEREKSEREKRKANFEDIYLKWFAQYKNTVKQSTSAKTKQIFDNHILKAFGHLDINDITIAYAQEVLNSWFNHTQIKYKRYYNYAVNVIDYAIHLELVESNSNILKKLIMPRKQEKIGEEEKKNYYTKEELLLFLETLRSLDNQKAYTLFYLLSFSGMRKGEALALNWKDIDFKNKTVSINKALTRGYESKLYVDTPKNNQSFRTISLDDSTIKVLKEWKINQKIGLESEGFTVKNSQLIFSNSNNLLMNPQSTRKYILQVLKKNKELSYITTHGFRHTHCSLLFEAGATIKEVQERLGHSDIHTTMNIYTHVSKQIKVETANKFADYILKN